MNIIAGGRDYKWRGSNIRNINIAGYSCVTMPRKDSFVVVPISVKPLCNYKIYFQAKNTGGDGKISVELFEPHVVGEKIPVNVNSSEFSEYCVEIRNQNISGVVNVRFGKIGPVQGNLVIKEVCYEKVVKEKIEAQVESKEDSVTAYQKEIGELEAKISKEFRETELKNILATRGNSMAIIGGNGYRWRGRGIKSVHKEGMTCVELLDRNSIIMVPVSISGNSAYKISISGSKSSGGNGALLVHFFGGTNFDGKYATLNITSSDIKEHVVTITSPNFPSNLPIYLRVWRPEDATGKVCVKIIQYNKLEAPKPKVNPNPVDARIRRIRASMSKSNKTNKKAEETSTDFPGVYEDVTSMQFRPYELRKNSTEQISKVMIVDAGDVPKVSIITPTRDGLDLLKKCYEAMVKNTSYPNWEWIIGDSASTDGTIEYIKSLNDPKIKLIERGTTDGSFSSINNELVQYATGEYLLFLNNDTEPQPFWLHEMMSKIIRNPDIGIVGAKLMYNQNKVQHAGICFIPQGPANIGHSVLDSFSANFDQHDRYYQAVTGACMLMRTSDFKAVDGFDPIYYFCYEDVDLCLKVRKRLKKKVLYAANAVLKHAESITQKKYKTAGLLQQEGIKAFKERWMREVEIDFGAFQKDVNKNVCKVDISFVTCINNMTQYINYVVNSLFKNNTTKNYEIIPILNFDNPYSAARALNLGIEKARGDIVVLCHQDVIFYENWINMLFDRIGEIESTYTKKWGIIGTAGITTRDDTFGVVHSIKGTIQWQSTKRTRVGEVQTVDEHCMILKKSTGLRFDPNTFDGFHFYGPDICLLSLSRGYKNFGILCPLVHDSNSGSLASGRNEFMRLLHALAKKWKTKFSFIRTPTSIIRKKSVRTFVRFKK